MKCKDVLKELLNAVFGSTTVKPTGDKIYRSGDLFSSCEFSTNDYNSYLRLLRIAFINNNPQIQRPNYEPEDFNRDESISNFFDYLRDYDEYIRIPDIESPNANKFAYNAAKKLLEAICCESSESDKFVIENEDITDKFREALNEIKDISIKSNPLGLEQILEINKLDELYDTDYSDNKSKCNYFTTFNTAFNLEEVLWRISEIKLKIYIDESGEYPSTSKFFFNDITSSFGCNESNTICNEMYLEKPISLENIKEAKPFCFQYFTYLDEETVLKKYKGMNSQEVYRMIYQKALKQYNEKYDKTHKAVYEKSLVNYIDDIIHRIMSLDLQWLYSNTAKDLNKCREEVKKILVGYPEIYTYLDRCDDNIIETQLLTILHHAVTEITKFIKCHGEYISQCAIIHDCSKHIRYVKGKVKDSNLKMLDHLIENQADGNNDSDVKTLRDMYYYTSSNELRELLNILREYKGYFKKSRKIS